MVRHKNLSFNPGFIYSLACSLAILLSLLGIGELYMRLFHHIPAPPYDNKVKDDVLGWSAIPYYHYKTDNFPDNKKGHYPVNINFGKHGFRKWNNSCKDSSGKTIFFIGDSYTESLQTGDDQTFYNLLSDSLHFKLFAAGVSGYGTTQELILLKTFIDSVKPDYVVLEMCQNDFADNYWKLEEVGGYKVGKERPYLNQDGRIEYHYPHYWVEDIRGYSFFLNFLIVRIQNALIRLNFTTPGTAADRLVAEKDTGYDIYREACLRTENSLRKINTIVNERGAELLVFDADDFEPSAKHIHQFCEINNIPVIDSIAFEVRKHENGGETVRAYDGYHWNPNGQKVVADKMMQYFRRNIMSKQ